VDAVTDSIKDDNGADGHGRGNLNADYLLQAARGHDDVLGGEGEGSDGRGKWLAEENAGGDVGGNCAGLRGSNFQRRGERASDGGEGTAEPAGGVVVADTGGLEVDSSASGSVEVIANDEAIEVLNDGDILDGVGTIRNVDGEVGVANDQASTADTAETIVANAMSDLRPVDQRDAVGKLVEQKVGGGKPKEGHGAAGVRAIGGKGGSFGARADLNVSETSGPEEPVEAINDGGRPSGSWSSGGEGAGSGGRRGGDGRGQLARDGVEPIGIRAGGDKGIVGGANRSGGAECAAALGRSRSSVGAASKECLNGAGTAVKGPLIDRAEDSVLIEVENGAGGRAGEAGTVQSVIREVGKAVGQKGGTTLGGRTQAAR